MTRHIKPSPKSENKEEEQAQIRGEIGQQSRSKNTHETAKQRDPME